MGKASLFRWEDFEALKHHCGVCDRPLSHPTAKSSCFGIHAEPCHRFHQMMFMRNRGHTCDMCLHTDEHHHKRHVELCQQIRSIYDSCGEDWPIVPQEEGDRGKSTLRESDAVQRNQLPSASTDILLTKKEKKERRRQARAASRSKVTTQEDINHIASVVHSADPQEVNANPNNPAEIEEIEQHLKYNAHCYNQGQKNRYIKQFAHIPDADIDFGAEIDRIFDVLRITELLKRNHQNRGLRNKELANFKALVVELKEQITTDLVLVKRDVLEVRMRRAAFLRYTNRAGYDIMTKRYTDKDWKTGEKIRSETPASPSLDSLTAVDEEETDHDEFANPQENVRATISAMSNQPDRRHMELSHKKIGTSGLVEEVILSEQARITTDASKPLNPLRILNTSTTSPTQTSFPNFGNQRSSNSLYLKPALKISTQELSALSTECSSPGDLPHVDQNGADGNSSNSNSPSNAQESIEEYFKEDRNNGSWLFTQNPMHTEESMDPSHAPVESRKKKIKKKQREAKRKSRRASEKKPEVSLYTDLFSGDTEVDSPSEKLPPGTLSHGFMDTLQGSSSVAPYCLSEGDLHVAKEIVDLDFSPSNDLSLGLVEVSVEDVTVNKNKKYTIDEGHSENKDTSSSDGDYSSLITHKLPDLTNEVGKMQTQPAPVPTFKTGRHKDWVTFLELFKVDEASRHIFTPDHPVYANSTDCSLFHCPFEVSGTPNCPYHKTYCDCYDPLNPRNDKCIVYVDSQALCIGPFNYMQSEKLLAFFSVQPETKNRLMLVDYDLYPWLHSEGRNWYIDKLNWNEMQTKSASKKMPMRLMLEVKEYFRGVPKGRALKQVDQFQQLAARNARLNNVSCHPPITKEILETMRKKFENVHPSNAICYCWDHPPTNACDDENLVQCAYRNCPIGWYHRRCIEKLGYNKVTTWYCGFCEDYMQVEALEAMKA